MQRPGHTGQKRSQKKRVYVIKFTVNFLTEKPLHFRCNLICHVTARQYDQLPFLVVKGSNVNMKTGTNVYLGTHIACIQRQLLQGSPCPAETVADNAGW